METCGSATRRVCSAAGKLMCIHREKEFPALWEKIAAVGKFVQPPGVFVQPSEKNFGLLEKSCGCGKVCSAAGEFVQPSGKSVFGPLEKGCGCGKVCSAAGAFVQPPGMFILRKGKCNTGNKGKRFSFSGPILVVRLVLPCSFIS